MSAEPGVRTSPAADEGGEGTRRCRRPRFTTKPRELDSGGADSRRSPVICTPTEGDDEVVGEGEGEDDEVEDVTASAGGSRWELGGEGEEAREVEVGADDEDGEEKEEEGAEASCCTAAAAAVEVRGIGEVRGGGGG